MMKKDNQSVTRCNSKGYLRSFWGSVKITKADGSFLNGENDNMATNFIVKDTYTVIKKVMLMQME